MKKFFTTITILSASAIWSGEFVHEDDFWNCLESGLIVDANRIYETIMENEVWDQETFIRTRLMCIALRTKQNSIHEARWEVDRICYLIYEKGLNP